MNMDVDMNVNIRLGDISVEVQNEDIPCVWLDIQRLNAILSIGYRSRHVMGTKYHFSTYVIN